MMRKAKAEDIDELNALCFRSKAVWGYDDAFMEACREELSLDQAEIETTEIAVIEADGKIVGMAQIEFDAEDVDLKRIFVDPAVLKSGLGSRLFAWAVETARGQGGMVMGVDADPFVAPFYRKMGMRDIGRSPSGSIPGRFLPRLALEL
ncbi:MAG TPA: GNAT family N-acetyltransferase [Hyphomicrobiales bacterium]|nr:GNAT family N-acetyltransferase [Hyphomicrobiales bacterium]